MTNPRIEMFRKAVEEDPANELARFSLANELRDEGDLEGALAHYEGALEIQPDWIKVLIEIGKCRLGLGLSSEAAAPLSRARELILTGRDHELLHEVEELLEEAGV